MKHNTQQIEKERTRFREFLGTNRLRLTPGRSAVFEEVMDYHGHFAAEELVKKCQSKKRKVSRATVYRSLQELREAGVIRETAFGEKHHHFEHVYDEKLHHHARCLRCHNIIELKDQNEDAMYKDILEKLQFHPLGHELHFYGFCKNCVHLNKEKS